MTYMLLLNCALKLVEEIILYYDARSKKHQITRCNIYVFFTRHIPSLRPILPAYAVCNYVSIIL